jgi:RNAse (barnase) inhibitor barstar
MYNWTTIFSSSLNSGIYTASAGQDAVKEAALSCRLEYFCVDLKPAKEKADFLKIVAGSLGFPSYYGINWDAFADCLTDMSWKPASGYVLDFNHFEVFARQSPQDAEIVMSIMDSCISYWKEKSVPFYVVLTGPAPAGD